MAYPSNSPQRWAFDASADTVDPGAFADVGFVADDPARYDWLNWTLENHGEWLTYLEDIAPSDGVLRFREWECPDDSSYDLRWSDASSPASDGILQGALKGATITLDSGFRFAVSGSGSLGFSAADGVYLYGFTYDETTDTIVSGSPPDLLDIYAPAACQVLSNATMTIVPSPDGSVVLTTALAGNTASASVFLGYHSGAKGDEASAGVTECYLRAASIQVLNHNESGGGSPNTTVSIQSMAADGTWTTRATSTLTTTILLTPTSVSIAPLTSSAREIPRGAPLRMLVDHAAILGQTQQIEILSVSLTYIRTAVD